MNPESILRTSGVCSNCKITTDGILYRQISQSDAVTYLRRCAKCNRANPFGAYKGVFIPKEMVETMLTLEQLEALPTLMADALPRCVVCGKRGAEMHHWAPKAICGLDMAERYPKDYLCLECYQDWHRKVTPSIAP